MKESFTNIDAAEAFLAEKAAEKKYVISMRLTTSGEYVVEWQDHKDYVDHQGNTHPDEVWFTEDQRMILVQDLEPEHARNILRMMLRQEREIRDRMDQIMNHVIEAAAELAEEDGMLNDTPNEDNPPPGGTMLH